MMSCDVFSSPPLDHITNPNPSSPNSAKRKRNQPGNPDPDAEVIALSPKSLMATNRFVCEICSKGFQRDQNLQLHKRGHNLPWKLKQRNKLEVVRKKVYTCPEISCVHHEASRALGDLTGVKKHFSRKHGEKKWKCEKCTKKYAVQSDWKAHSKICGTREYKCDCGILFSRKDSFVTHRAFCDALTQENSRTASFSMVQNTTNLNFHSDLMMMNLMKPKLPNPLHNHHHANNINPPENSTNSSFLGSSSSNNNDINAGILSPEMVQWLSRSQEKVGNFTELPLGFSVKEEEVNNIGEMQLSTPLYDNNYGGYTYANPPPPPPSPPPPPHMSAATTNNSGGFGLMNTSDLSVFGSLNQNRNNGGSQFENVNGEMMNGDGLMMMMMMAELKQKSTGGIDSGERNLTRDFLGIEGNERRAFSLQQELFNFTCSMNDDHSSIDFSGSTTQ